MQRQCTIAWVLIYRHLQDKPEWDHSLSDFGQSPQRAADAIISTSPITGHYPLFMDTVAAVIQNYKQNTHPDQDDPQGEVCLMNMIKYHAKTARLFRDDGPLSVETLFKGWPETYVQAKRERFREAVALADEGAGNDVKEMFKEQGMRSIMGMMGGWVGVGAVGARGRGVVRSEGRESNM